MISDLLVTTPALGLKAERIFRSKEDPELPLYLDLINKTKTKIYKIADLDINVPKLGIRGTVKAYLAQLDYPVARYAYVVDVKYRGNNVVAIGFTNDIHDALRKLDELLVQAGDIFSRMVKNEIIRYAVEPKVQKVYEEITPLIDKLVESIHKKTGVDYMYLFEAIADVVRHEMIQEELANVIRDHPEFIKPLDKILEVARKLKEIYTFKKYERGILNQLGSKFKNVEEIKI